MTSRIPRDFIQTIAQSYRLTSGELETLLIALEGYSIREIAHQLKISEIAVRKRLGEVYKKCNIRGNSPGKLGELRHQLLGIYQTQNLSPSLPPFSPLLSLPSGKTTLDQNWEESPQITQFYGREEELNQLTEWSQITGGSLIALLGFKGMGKTTLGIKLSQELQTNFDLILWRSLRFIPPSDIFFEQLINRFQQKFPTPMVGDRMTKLSQIMSYLCSYKILLIFDDYESIFTPKTLAGIYQEDAEIFHHFIHQITTLQHSSCLLILSQEDPQELSLLRGKNVKKLSLSISRHIVETYFQEYQLFPTDEQWQFLLNRYPNLLALKIIPQIISQFFDQKITDFLACSPLILEQNLTDLLAGAFTKLSELEKNLLYRFSLATSPVSWVHFQQDVILELPVSDLVKIVESLKRRFWIENVTEKGQILLTLSPWIKQYIREKLITQIKQEIVDFIQSKNLQSFHLLKTHRFCQVREENQLDQWGYFDQQLPTQIRFLFFQEIGYQPGVNALKNLLNSLENGSPLAVGYLPENIPLILSFL